MGDVNNKYDIYMLEPEINNEDKYSLYSNGTLWTSDLLLTMYDFCVENMNNTLRIFVCFDVTPKPTIEFQYFIYPVCLLLSIPFLLATAATYTFIEEFRDLQGKALSCQVLSLAIAYFILSIIQLGGNNIEHEMCTGIAFTLQFFFLACFFWLNVLSYDAYRNIRHDPRTMYNKGSPKSERRMFIFYSLYAWYGPGILLIVSLVMDLTPGIPDSYIKPKFGANSCWFHSNSAALPYFYGPAGFLIALNSVFFILSAISIHREYKRTTMERINTEGKIGRQMQIYISTLKQCVLLFLVMGLSWIAEIISWAAGGSEYIWLVTDLFNTFQGIVIFYIFVVKEKRVRAEVLRRLRNCWTQLSRKRNEPVAPEETVNDNGYSEDEEDEESESSDNRIHVDEIRGYTGSIK